MSVLTVAVVPAGLDSFHCRDSAPVPQNSRFGLLAYLGPMQIASVTRQHRLGSPDLACTATIFRVATAPKAFVKAAIL